LFDGIYNPQNHQMKKYLVTIAVISLIVACGDSASNSGNADSTASGTSNANDITSNPDYTKGLQLIAASDCLTCHKVDEKVTGPPYRDVANKYENTEANVKMLAEKVMKGGSGNWGTVPMTPHPAISEADAEQMVKYILLLRNK
jgi:cytochrome c